MALVSKKCTKRRKELTLFRIVAGLFLPRMSLSMRSCPVVELHCSSCQTTVVELGSPINKSSHLLSETWKSASRLSCHETSALDLTTWCHDTGGTVLAFFAGWGSTSKAHWTKAGGMDAFHSRGCGKTEPSKNDFQKGFSHGIWTVLAAGHSDQIRWKSKLSEDITAGRGRGPDHRQWLECSAGNVCQSKNTKATKMKPKEPIIEKPWPQPHSCFVSSLKIEDPPTHTLNGKSRTWNELTWSTEKTTETDIGWISDLRFHNWKWKTGSGKFTVK